MQSIRRTLVKGSVFAGLLGGLVAAHATLWDRGNGLIYDDVQNITWLQDWNYARTSTYAGADVNGLMTWQAAMTWAATLSYGGHSGWRLPTTDVSCPPPYFVCIGSEMGHLWHVDLNNVIFSPVNMGPFTNWYPGHYWTSNESAANPDAAWYFVTDQGNQNFFWKGVQLPAVAVHEGDITQVPEPTIAVLLMVGGCVLLRTRRSR